jgi:hypothetical protein
MKIRKVKRFIEENQLQKLKKKKTKVETFDSFNEALQQIRKQTKNYKEKPQEIIKKQKQRKYN